MMGRHKAVVEAMVEDSDLWLLLLSLSIKGLKSVLFDLGRCVLWAIADSERQRKSL